MLGVFVNVTTVIIGSLIGLIIKKGIPERLTSAVMIGIGMRNICMGVQGMMDGKNILILIGATVIGAIIGTLADIDGKINKLGDSVSKKFKSTGKTSIAEGFINGSLVFCVGAMTINGSLNAGITGDNSLLYTKATLDLFSSSMLAASLGIGVMFAAAFVLGFQGLLVLLAGFLAPVLTESAIAEMTCAGSLIIIAIGTNVIGITKIKVADYLPAIALAPLFCWIIGFF